MTSPTTPSKPAAPVEPSQTRAADPSSLPPLPKDHLDHPEQWATGDEPATEKQKGFIKVLEGRHEGLVPPPGLDVEAMGKSEASEVIDKLKNGQAVGSRGASGATGVESANGAEEQGTEETETAAKEEAIGEEEEDDAAKTDGKKRKTPPNSTPHGSAKAQPGTPAGDHDGAPTDGDPTGVDDETPSKPKGQANVGPSKDDKGHVEKRAKVDSGAETAHAEDGTIPGDGEHLDHPENWATGDEPATSKQKGYVAVLEKKAGVSVGSKEGMGKSEASEVIEELKAKAG